jgi:hypothetical protein
MTASQGLMRKVENMKFRMDASETADDSYFEVENQSAGRNKERIFISGVKGVHSTGKIAKRMRDNRGVLLLSLKDLAKSDELRPCIERIKKDCRDNNYEMAVIDNEWLMMLPRDAGMELISE